MKNAAADQSFAFWVTVKSSAKSPAGIYTAQALITADGGLLYTYYQSNRGNPVAVVLERLSKGSEKKFLLSQVLASGSLVIGMFNAFM